MLLAALQAIACFAVVFVAVALLGSGAEKSLSKDFPWQFRVAAACRTPVLMFFVVPLSFLQRLRTRMRRRWRRLKLGAGGAQNRHSKNVDAIVVQVKAWNAAGRKKLMRTARETYQSMNTKLGSNKHDCHLITTSTLNEILEIDAERLTLTAEPGVTMGELTDVLLPLGLALQTHVEMESITIGGVAMGFGIETNSHRFGFFQESVLAYELIDASAGIQTVTAASDPRLFYALPWSHGTLGFLASLKVRLVRTKPYIRIVYEPTRTAYAHTWASNPHVTTAHATSLAVLSSP